MNTKHHTCLKPKWTLKQVFVQISAKKKGRGPSSIYWSLICAVEQKRVRISTVLFWPCFEKLFYYFFILNSTPAPLPDFPFLLPRLVFLKKSWHQLSICSYLAFHSNSITLYSIPVHGILGAVFDFNIWAFKKFLKSKLFKMSLLPLK